MNAIDLTRIIIIGGYVTVAILAWTAVVRFPHKGRVAAAAVIAVYTTGWALFYSTLFLVDVANTLTAVTLGSRLAHLPTIAAGFVLLVMLNDLDRKEAELLKVLDDE